MTAGYILLFVAVWSGLVVSLTQRAARAALVSIYTSAEFRHLDAANLSRVATAATVAVHSIGAAAWVGGVLALLFLGGSDAP